MINLEKKNTASNANTTKTAASNHSVWNKLKIFLQNLWHGKYPMSTMFWVFGVLVITIAMAIVKYITEEFEPGSYTSTILYDIIFLYGIVISIGIWRSAKQNAVPKIWSIAARILVIFALFVFAGSLFEKANDKKFSENASSPTVCLH